MNATETAGFTPFAVAITPNGEYAYVTNQGTVTNYIGMVSVISIDTNTVITASSSPAAPEFPTQLLTIILLVSIIIVLSVFIIAKKLGTLSRRSNENQSTTKLNNQAK